MPEPGIVQVWTGLFIESAENWSVLVRPPANLPRSLAFDLYEGIVETDRWFGPLFTNLRLVKTDVPIHFSTETPLVQVQPLHRSTYAEEVSNGFAVVDDPREFPAEAWERYEETIVKPNLDPARPVGAYADLGAAPAPERLPGARRVNGYCGRGHRGAHLGVVSGGDPRRRHRLVRAAGTGDAALRRRRPAVPALSAAAFRAISRAAWLQGVPLTLFQGAGMAALVICGLQLAPANHAAALGPGVNAGLGRAARIPGLRQAALAARRRRARCCARSACCCSPGGAPRSATRAVLAGDAMFLAASALGALYVLQLRSWGIGAIQGAAIVSLYSALVVVPWYLWSAPAAALARGAARAPLAGPLAGRADRLRRARRAEPRHLPARAPSARARWSPWCRC